MAQGGHGGRTLRRLPGSSARAYALKLLVVAVAYYAAARLGLQLALVGESVTPLWPPTGVALVALLAAGYRIWPAIAAAAFAVNAPISPSLAAAAGIAVGNTLAPLVAAAVLSRLGFRTELERVRDALGIVTAALGSMLISATIGTTTLMAAGAITSDRYAETWSVWWTGDAMGVLIVAPFLWSLWPVRRARVRPARVAEAAALFAVLIAATVIATQADRHLLFLALPLLGTIAWRLQQRGAAPAGLLVSSIVIWAAAHDSGPFAGETLLSKMAVLQGYNAAVAFTSFFFAAAVGEKLRAREELERAAGELDHAVRARTAELTFANDRLIREVEERTRAQRVLQQREFQLAEAQTIAHVGSWEWDIRRDQVGWSDELFRIYGVEPGTFRGTYEAFLERVHPDDRASVDAVIQQALQDSTGFTLEHRLVRPDGSERTVSARGAVIVDPAGLAVRMVGTAQDVTERSLTDRALRESEERFRTVFESSAVGMAQCDTAGRLMRANMALQKLLDYPEEELYRLSFLELTHAGDRQRFVDLFDRLLRGQLSSFDIEKRLRRRDGTDVWVHSSVSLVREAAGTARFVHALVQDVTERRRAEALQRAEAERVRLHELFSTVPAVVFVTRGPSHVIEFANDAFSRVLRSREILGKPLGEVVPEMAAHGQLDLIDRVFTTGRPFAASEAPLGVGGAAGHEERLFNLVYQPVRAPAGDIEGVLAHAVDVTETVRGRQRVTESFALLDTLLRTAPAGFAVFDPELRAVRVNERFATMSGSPVEAHLGRRLPELMPDLADALEPSLRQVLHTREPIVDVEVSGASFRPPRERHWLASFYPILTPGGECLGVGVVFVEITERKRSEKLLSGQKEVLELIARGARRPDVLHALTRMAEEQSSGDTRAAILLADARGRSLHLGAAPSLALAFRRAIDGVRIDASADPCSAAVHDGAPVLVADIAADPRWAASRDLAAGNGLRAAWSWPILAGDRSVLGAFCLYCAEARLPTERERELLDVLTHTAAIAIERDRAEQERLQLVDREREAQALLYQREHHVAETLQRSLLPERLPETPGVLVAARYMPARADVEVGGDWYDIIPLSDGRLGLAIGDVAGHGISAAAAMGQMRMALRAYALEELSPAQALQRLNRLLLELQPGAMSTVQYAQFDPGTGVVCFASAGHPPPLLLDLHGGATFVEGGLAPPLGVSPTIDYEEATTMVEPGSTLFLYTDGLVERRGAAIDDGLELFRGAAREAPEELEEACDHILAALLGGGVADDVALLALRSLSFAGHPLRVRRHAAPGTVPETRRILRRWLVENGAGEDEAYEILVAFAEAYTNAVQHAYGPADGVIDVEATVHDDEIAITVRDYGAWRPPRPSEPEDGGRGLLMMQGLMEVVDVASSVDGTEVRMRRRLGALVGDG